MTRSESLISVLGHYCHDTVYRADGTRHESLGGSPSFISSVLRAAEVAHTVIAKVGGDFKYGTWVNDHIGQSPLVDPLASTTAFLADFRNHGQRQKILDRCSPISIEEVAQRWNAGSNGVVLLTGVVGEISPALIRSVRQRAKVLIADIQGFIRTTDTEGWVTHQKLEDTEFASILGLLDYLKVSEDEARALDFSKIPDELTVLETRGAKGTRIHRVGSGRPIDVESCRVNEVDPTGAGDSFVAGLAVGLVRGEALQDAVRFANRCGALAVQKIGVPDWTPSEFGSALARLAQ